MGYCHERTVKEKAFKSLQGGWTATGKPSVNFLRFFSQGIKPMHTEYVRKTYAWYKYKEQRCIGF